jgi:hypothetical protein
VAVVASLLLHAIALLHATPTYAPWGQAGVTGDKLLSVRVLPATAHAAEVTAPRADAVASGAPLPTRASTARLEGVRDGSSAPASSWPEDDGRRARARSEYWPADALDRRPLVRSAPDDERIHGVSATGQPVRVRVFIDERGNVADVEILEVASGDLAVAQRIADMFRDTGFIPGRLDGRDVASFVDIEVEPPALHVLAEAS